MDFSAPHVNFVLACYGISAFMLAVMTIAIMVRARSGDKQLARLEALRGKPKPAGKGKAND
jgi:heme exporter protein CcmD